MAKEGLRVEKEDVRENAKNEFDATLFSGFTICRILISRFCIFGHFFNYCKWN